MSSKKYMTINQKANRKLFVKIFFALLAGAIIFFACAITAAQQKHVRYEKTAVYILGALVWIFLVYKMRIINMLCDREWRGEIVSINHRNGYYTPYLVFGHGGMKETIYIDLVVKTEKGKTKHITYNSVYITPSYYFEGMKVTHKRGSKYLVYTDPPKNKIICPICTETLDTPYCSRCKIRF